MHLTISQWNQFILCEIIPNVTSHTFRRSGIYRMNKNDNCLLLVLTLCQCPIKAFENCCTIIDYFEAKDVIIIKNSLFQFLLEISCMSRLCNFFVRTFTMMALSIILGQIMKFSWSLWSTWIIISVNCYSVTYELTYHHFPNPIESELVNLFFLPTSHLTTSD